MSEVPIFKFALREDLSDTGDLFLPTKGEPNAAGWDIRAAQNDRKDIVLRAGQYFKIPLGFKSFCPENWYYLLHPRSSSFAKKHMHCLIGVIDTDYNLEVSVAGMYLPDINTLGKDLLVKFGDAIGQIIPTKRPIIEIKTISNEDYNDLCGKRNAIRNGGFGSTDFKQR